MTGKHFSIQPKPTRYNGILFRSRVEARWATFFDVAGMPYDYEPEGFVIHGETVYLPDFWLRQQRMYLEVKGVEPDLEELAKCAALSELAQVDCLLAVGNPDDRFQIYWFNQTAQPDASQLWTFAHDRYSTGGFWLLADHDARAIGPALRSPGGPLIDPLMPAYEAAKSARFDTEDARRRQAPIVYPADAHEARFKSAA